MGTTGKRAFGFAVILAGVILAAVGCIPTRQWQGGAVRDAQEWSDGVQPTVESIDVARIGTLAALDVQEKQAHLDATAQAAAAAATVEAIRAGAEVQRVAATRYAAESTAQAWDRHSQATEAARAATAQAAANANATAEARSATATAEARRIEETRQAVAIEGTRARQTWEQDATATAWAVGYQATADAQFATRQAQATADVVNATRQAHVATATRAAEQREQTLGAARDYGLPILLLGLIGCIVGLIVWGVRQWSQRPIVYERSLLGDAQPMAVPQIGGGFAFVDLDRQPGPVLKVLPTGQVDAPRLRSPAQEERTTARDQALDGMSRPRLGGGHGSQPALPMSEPPQAKPEGLAGVRVLRRLDQAATAGLLPPGQIEAIEAVWQDTED